MTPASMPSRNSRGSFFGTTAIPGAPGCKYLECSLVQNHTRVSKCLKTFSSPGVAEVPIIQGPSKIAQESRRVSSHASDDHFGYR